MPITTESNVCRNFSIREFFPKHFYNKFKNQSIKFIDPRIYVLADKIREYFDKTMTINDWAYGGKFNYRGFRPNQLLIESYTKNEKAFGSLTSQHAFGRAIDFHFDAIDTEEARQEIIRVRDEKFPEITAIEMDVNWIHVDVRANVNGELLTFYPSKF